MGSSWWHDADQGWRADLPPTSVAGAGILQQFYLAVSQSVYFIAVARQAGRSPTSDHAKVENSPVRAPDSNENHQCRTAKNSDFVSRMLSAGNPILRSRMGDDRNAITNY
jgi:hypothetical protein